MVQFFTLSLLIIRLLSQVVEFGVETKAVRLNLITIIIIRVMLRDWDLWDDDDDGEEREERRSICWGNRQTEVGN